MKYIEIERIDNTLSAAQRTRLGLTKGSPENAAVRVNVVEETTTGAVCLLGPLDIAFVQEASASEKEALVKATVYAALQTTDMAIGKRIKIE